MLAGVARPSVNALVEFGVQTFRPDFWWVLAQLVVEVDGPGHLLPSRVAEDRARDEQLARAGVEVLRFTDDEVVRDVDACVRRIIERLEARCPNITR